MATYSRRSESYVDGVESVSVVHERGRGIAWRIWPGAHVLLDWLESHRDEWCANPCHCVEIGAGVGLVGVVCAGLGASRVTLTDLPEELPALERSRDSNTAVVKDRIHVGPLSFGVDSELDAISRPHSENLVVVGSELIYWESLFEPIAKTLQRFAHEYGAKIFIGYRKRVWKTEKRFFTKVLGQFGLDCEVLGQWLAVEEDGASQKTDGQVVYKTSEDGEWDTRVYRIFAKSMPVVPNIVEVEEWEGKRGKHSKQPAPKVEPEHAQDKGDSKKKPKKIVRQEKKGRVR
jgi:predicted nicotinamide N-methyase